MQAPLFLRLAWVVALLLGMIPAHAGTAPAPPPSDSVAWTVLLQQTEAELATLHRLHEDRTSRLRQRLAAIEGFLATHRVGRNSRAYTAALEEKIHLLDSLEAEDENFHVQLLRARYLKGLDLVKLLYEKVLALDHHFTALQTYQHINSLSNPNQFPDFQKNKEIMTDRLRRKSGVRMPTVLQNNVYLASTFSLVSALFGEGDVSQKEKDLEQVACILDFTLRMNNDLNTIYYETEFLRQNNESLRNDCIALFADYAKPIAYTVSLDKCRETDDWETVHELVEKAIQNIEALDKDPAQFKASLKAQINMEFSIDRLLDFINKYVAFINQGEKYYQKFEVILSNYANESVCAAQLPRQFIDLKKDVAMSIDKFRTSYSMAEIKGSKLKDLLYGTPPDSK